MKKCLLFTLLFLAGCAEIGNPKIGNTDQVRRYISANISTPEALVARYGQPQQIFTRNGQQIYEYSHIKVTGMPDDEYSTGAQHYRSDYIYVYFDDGILTKVENISRRGRYPPEDVFAPYLKTEKGSD